MIKRILKDVGSLQLAGPMGKSEYNVIVMQLVFRWVEATDMHGASRRYMNVV